MATREEAIDLAKTDTTAALTCARKIEKPWYRCQALAWVARFAPDGEFVSIAEEALDAASNGEDYYQMVAVAAWPIRALIERSALERAESATRAALLIAPEIVHTGSRAEAHMLLLHATLPSPWPFWKPVFEAILRIPYPPVHWRLRRALRDAVLMVYLKDPELAASSLPEILDEKALSQINVRIGHSPNEIPRKFFW